MRYKIFLFVLALGLAITLSGVVANGHLWFKDDNNSPGERGKPANSGSKRVEAPGKSQPEASYSPSGGSHRLADEGYRPEEKDDGQAEKDYRQPKKNFSFADIETAHVGKQRINILLAGVDQRPNDLSLSNTDTLIICSFTPSNQRVALLSVPRDTQIDLPGHGKEKINVVARLEHGMRSTVTELEKLSGQKIDGYILTSFPGFKEIVDILGGITVEVEKDMYYVVGDEEDGVIDLKKGRQRLNGSETLQYVRFRQDALADISRTARQQQVLKAMAAEFFQAKNLVKAPALIREAYNSIQTDLSAGQLLGLAILMGKLKPEQIVTQTLPGNFAIEDEISYWKVEPDECRVTVREFFTDGKTVPVFAKEKARHIPAVHLGVNEKNLAE